MERKPDHSEIAVDPLESPTLAKLAKKTASRSPSLIEFPGTTRQVVPEWRKELGERVREVQERRAREASLESGEVDTSAFSSEGGIRQLELLAKPSIPPTNPLVVAALRRIERAHARAQFSGNTAIATAVYEEQPAFDLELVQAPVEGISFVPDLPSAVETPEETEAVVPEKTHNLSVVAAPAIVSAEEPSIIPEEIERENEPSYIADDDIKTSIKPRRMIRENDPALNYLDSVSTTITVDVEHHRSAPVFFRIFCSILDLLIIGILAAPIVAIVKLTEIPWRDPRVIGFAAGTVVVAAFLYLTVNTALAGRTFAMRIFSLRVVDLRTGLIPTGTQAAGRAFFYLLSLATAGIGLMYVFVDREKRTAHDRFTRTAVVRV